MNGESMVGFGYKQAWLAIRDGRPEAVTDALGLRDLGPVSWRDGIDLAYLTDDRVVLTPPLPGAGNSRWLLVTGRWLFGRGLLDPGAAVDVTELSATLGTEVQFFATYRVGEAHRWERAVDGRLVRAFGYVGESGEVVQWRGEPDAAETAMGIAHEPDAGTETDILVSEDDVMRLAGMWSVDPSGLGAQPSSGPLRAAAAP
ncbi:hypothetical protein Raf01_85050 [Rugosimonospora africana]|uniref:Uncharacterized protein n=1 Tax=Rugosimonospora africana TaxID=556532 RepID=A0A8J3R2A4_9ACTN|nr:hypothetical protein Raf01_85050 [Rugosimonospora africana]